MIFYHKKKENTMDDIKIFTGILPLCDFCNGENNEDMNSTIRPDEQINGEEPTVIVVRKPPMKAPVLKFGKVTYSQDGEDGSFDFTPSMADDIITEYNKRAKDIVIDYEHGTLNKGAGAEGKSIAAGWCGLEIDPEGLVMTVKNWTPSATQKLTDGEYRYISPVVRFNKQTKKPAEIHSIALTNHPAIHGMEALVAANDTKNEAVESFQNTIKSIHEGIGSMQELLEKTICEYSDNVKGTPEEAKMIAFNDSLFGQDIKAFADVSGLIIEKRNGMTGPEMISWLNNQIANTVDTQEKAQYQAEIDRLNKFASDFPDLWTAGFTNGNNDTLALLQKTKQPEVSPMAMEVPSIAMSDIATLIGINDIEKAKSEIKSMSDMKKGVDEVLALYDVKNLDDLGKKIASEKEAIVKREKELKDTLVMNDANTLVKGAMEEGKITEAMKEIALKLALNDSDSFKTWVKALPVIAPKGNGTMEFSDISGKGSGRKKLSKEDWNTVRIMNPNINTEEEALKSLGRI